VAFLSSRFVVVAVGLGVWHSKRVAQTKGPRHSLSPRASNFLFVSIRDCESKARREFRVNVIPSWFALYWTTVCLVHSSHKYVRQKTWEEWREIGERLKYIQRVCIDNYCVHHCKCGAIINSVSEYISAGILDCFSVVHLTEIFTAGQITSERKENQKTKGRQESSPEKIRRKWLVVCVCVCVCCWRRQVVYNTSVTCVLCCSSFLNSLPVWQQMGEGGATGVTRSPETATYAIGDWYIVREKKKREKKKEKKNVKIPFKPRSTFIL
jgi:hypothetical protein